MIFYLRRRLEKFEKILSKKSDDQRQQITNSHMAKIDEDVVLKVTYLLSVGVKVEARKSSSTAVVY